MNFFFIKSETFRFDLFLKLRASKLTLQYQRKKKDNKNNNLERLELRGEPNTKTNREKVDKNLYVFIGRIF